MIYTLHRFIVYQVVVHTETQYACTYCQFMCITIVHYYICYLYNDIYILCIYVCVYIMYIYKCLYYYRLFVFSIHISVICIILDAIYIYINKLLNIELFSKIEFIHRRYITSVIKDESSRNRILL